MRIEKMTDLNSKVEITLNRIKMFDPLQFSENPYYVAYSGGKDSDVIRILTNLANVKYDLVHNHTTVDAPETVYYIRTIPEVQIGKPRMSMWDLIVKNKIPPTRLMRYCCKELKERGGKDRIVMTGVRWSESVQRKNRSGLEILKSKKANTIYLNVDNCESRKMLENCQIKGKRVLNPIIDWNDEEVWEFLKTHGCTSNPLYQEGEKRVGCIGCPMSGIKGRERDFIRYPQYKESYIRAFQRMINEYIYKPTWNTGQEVFDWWMSK